jgi:hypothetical protein
LISSGRAGMAARPDNPVLLLRPAELLLLVTRWRRPGRPWGEEEAMTAFPVTFDTTHRAMIFFGSNIAEDVNAVVVRPQESKAVRVVAWPWVSSRAESDSGSIVWLCDKVQPRWCRPVHLDVLRLPAGSSGKELAIFTLDLGVQVPHYVIPGISLSERDVEKRVASASSWPNLLDQFSPIFSVLRYRIDSGSDAKNPGDLGLKAEGLRQDLRGKPLVVGAEVAGFLCELLHIY